MAASSAGKRPQHLLILRSWCKSDCSRCPFATEIASLSILHTCLGLPIGKTRFDIAAIAFHDEYHNGINDDENCKPPEHAYYTERIEEIAALFDDNFPGVAQVRSSTTTGSILRGEVMTKILV